MIPDVRACSTRSVTTASSGRSRERRSPGLGTGNAHASRTYLTKRAGQLGFADLGAYLADRVTQRAWTLVQVAGELVGVDRNTVRDRLDDYGLRPTKPTAR